MIFRKRMEAYFTIFISLFFIAGSAGAQRSSREEFEIIVRTRIDADRPAIEKLARSLHLTIQETQPLPILGSMIYRLAARSASRASNALQLLPSQPAVLSAQRNNRFVLQTDSDGYAEGDPAQYGLRKVHLGRTHDQLRGEGVRIGVIDSEPDAAHSELAGSLSATHRVLPQVEKPHSHGTGVIGQISAHGRLMGVAPLAQIYDVIAFTSESNGTTYGIALGIQWAVDQRVRVLNMSFAGPRDPLIQVMLKVAHNAGVVLVAAAGNNGPNGLPLYPAADPSVIAVTAIGSEDRLFPAANRGRHIAISAPGVDIFMPAPEGKYQMSSGTSFAAPYVSGIVALMLEANPSLTPEQVRLLLTQTARNLGPSERFGAGLVDAVRAIEAAKGYPNR